MSSATAPNGNLSYLNADRFYVHLTVLKELKMYDEATTLLESEAGKAKCITSLICEELRREIWKLKGSAKEEGERAQQRIQERE